MLVWFENEVVIFLYFKMFKNVRVYYICIIIYLKIYFYVLYIVFENEIMYLYFIFLNLNSFYIYM